MEAPQIDDKMEPRALSDSQQTPATAPSSTEKAPAAPGSEDITPGVPTSASPGPQAGSADDNTVALARSPSPASTLEPARASSSPVVSSPSATTAAQPVAAHPGPLDSNPVLTFREIMEVPAQAQRIAEFRRARAHFAQVDTGLQTILERLASHHPDIVQASGVLGRSGPVYNQQLPSVQDIHSSTTASASPAPVLAHRQHGLQANHIRPKTKEFFTTAGRASKGLFSSLKAKGKKVAN